jgi:hypothetical protein
MSTIPTRFPLQWPEGWKRTESYRRKTATFTRHGKELSVFDGVERVISELNRLMIHADDVIVSTNVRTRLDGLPRSGEPKPADPGVCVYWQKNSKTPMHCMAVDRYTEVADNLAAIAATLEAMRAIERHGGAAILDRAFTGFTALPAPVGGRRDWWTVLALQQGATREEIEQAHRVLRSRWHPDRPDGNADRMAEINRARDLALQEIGS